MADNDFIFSADADLRYLGHDKAVYGFVLTSPVYNDRKVLILPLPPQSIEQGEEAAVTITPTQNAGKFIENHGSVIKDISISGTTGWLPRANFRNDQDSGVRDHAGQSGLSKKDIETALSYASGYAVFHKLRSLFREYWDIHQNNPDKSVRDGTTLTFVNTKDDEYWIVEPLSFRTHRSSKSPMGYIYSIQMRTIAKGTSPIDLEPTFYAEEKPADATVAESHADMKDNVAAVSEGVGVSTPLTSKIMAASAYVTDLASNIREAMTGAKDSILTPIRTLLVAAESVCYGFENIVEGVEQFVNIPSDMVGYVRDGVDAVFAAAYSAAVELPEALALSLLKIKQDAAYLAARPELFVTSVQRKWTAISRVYKAAGLDVPVPASSSVSSCLEGEDPWGMGQRLFGDAGKGYEIIVLNDLRYPYFSNSRLPGTRSPGDAVLVPTGGDVSGAGVGSDYRGDLPAFEGVISAATSTSVTVDPAHNVNWVDSQWAGCKVIVTSGVGAGQVRHVTGGTTTLVVSPAWSTTPSAGDLIRLDSVVSALSTKADNSFLRDVSLTDDWDIDLSPDGDFAISEGESNFMQALNIKLGTERKELPMQPSFGLAFPVGSKATVGSMVLYRMDAESTLMSDSRVASVSGVKVTAEGGTVRLQARISPRGTLADKSINTKF